ncbi:MAG: DUF6116 family protein [Nitrospiraceae bacterium]
MNTSGATSHPSWLYGLIAGLNLRFPTLFLLLVALTALDLVVPDPLPFVDEAFMILLTLLVGAWKTRRVSRAARPTKIVN